MIHFRSALPLALVAALAITPASAQRRPATPEQRIDRLEKQVRQVQGRVFPKGQPADTAGFSDEPAATQSTVTTISGRLDALERQMADLVRTSEENDNRLGTMEAEVARLRADQDRRFRALENAPAGGAVTSAADAGPIETAEPGPPPAPQPKVEASEAPAPAATTLAADEAAYDKGYRLWEAKKYDAAIAALKPFAATYPQSRRVSWANNLIGRAMLDKGDYRGAAEALLANYRGNPKGERAQDSLFYLGQSVFKLGQPTQACKAYAELENVYGSAVRPQLRSQLSAAKAAAKCN